MTGKKRVTVGNNIEIQQMGFVVTITYNYGCYLHV